LDLGEKWTWVQIFENKGALMGCSNTHPHCQIWASSFLPNEARIKDEYLKDYYKRNKKPLLIDYMHKEILKKVSCPISEVNNFDAAISDSSRFNSSSLCVQAII
jgi:galactose-1-phosphate uridylyltransferase (family 1)